MPDTAMERHEPTIGHNIGAARVEIEVRLFNSITRFAKDGGWRRVLDLEPGATVAHVLALLGVPKSEVFLVMVNGRDITRGLVGAPARTGSELDHGDVLALSGPVPYSFGYGAPVV